MPDKLSFVRLRRLGPLDRLFVSEAVKSLIPFRFQTRGKLKRGHRLPDHMLGLGVAVPKDTSELESVLRALECLQPGAVRIDLAPGQDATLLETLLEVLGERKCPVLLHLVQPFSEAGKMPEAQSMASWRQFVEQTLEAYANHIEAVEVGSVVNRVRWAGYSLAGFIAAWEAAVAAVKRYKHLLLVGPNVTDFEPQYNAGLLGIMRTRGCLPDVQSNNLFAERTIQPEVMDHKIGGHWAKSWIGYDLIRKSRLLAAIAGSKGVHRNWSTCAFWTLPRIARILRDEEQKAADYLVRYFVLCAAVGTFERIYWGPLVSQREGLIAGASGEALPDKSTDVVFFYGDYPAAPDLWRRRPAFEAFRTVRGLLAGARYLGALAHGAGLEVHRFAQDGRVTDVVWTQNAGLAATVDCYTTAALERLVEVRDGLGQVLAEPPDCIGERPVFLDWREQEAPELRAGAALLPQVRVAQAAGWDYFLYRDQDWRGLVRARCRSEARQLIEALHPEQIGAWSKEQSLRRARNAIWKINDPRGGELVVKRPERIAWHKRWLDRRKPSKALRSWNGTCELMRRGIGTAAAVAYFESRDRTALTHNWFICEQAGRGLSVRTFFSRFAAGEVLVEGISFEDFVAQLVPFLVDLHRRGVYFRDLSGGNILVEPGRAAWAFHLIDTARARFANQRFPLRARVGDLKRLAQKLGPQQQAQFMNSYLECEGRRYSAAQRLSVKLYQWKAALKRLKRRARKALNPRR